MFQVPVLFRLFTVYLLTIVSVVSVGKCEDFTIIAPPAELGLDPFYKKCVLVQGYPIVSSEKPSDYALKEAAFLVNLLLKERPDLREAMIKSKSRMAVMAYNEFTTDIPEHAHLSPKDYRDARSRGLGGSITDPVCTTAEENLLSFEGDPYWQECILIHEFAHNMHLRGMVNIDPTFDSRLQQAYESAMAAGLWKKTYASVNHHEYFAEGVQCWFDNNRSNDNEHGEVDTREELLEYDPQLAELCREVFKDTDFKYSKPTTRLKDHLLGYDPSTAPKFEWPSRLDAAREQIRDSVRKRNE
ncbi:hypothetical protein SH668x_002807 [Planctomicrobium sp. SH668]|uniref:hypothetical protein n=1 Tax=Planctomicrobium sp. SH668 TaxID=3448126 RepID=UPI003F5C9133